MKVIIAGGVAGGASAAARLRRLDENAEIIMFERTSYVSYANCGLPYYIGGKIEDQEDLTLQSPDSFRKRFNIDVRVKHEVLRIDPNGKKVFVKNLETGSVTEETYDKLILSPGAKPVKPQIPGAAGDRFFTLRTVEDTLRIRAFVETKRPKTALIVGGGYIGLEMAENLCGMGIVPSLIQRSDHVMPQLDADMASEVHALLRKHGVKLFLRDTVTAFESTGGAIRAALRSGQTLTADMVLLAIGVEPETKLAQEAGLATGTKNAIVVNERMQTSNEDIYAVGDAVEIVNFVTKKPALIPLAGPANKQGRIAADNIYGLYRIFTGTQGSSVIKLFDMTVAVTGITETAAKANGMDYDKVLTYSASHATYYPGATNMTIKTLFQPGSGKILGAQIVGHDGVDKRCDILATAIRGGMTAADLARLELSYAPPYSSAKDPVNMVGFLIENCLGGLVKQFHWHDVPALQADENVTLLDVRTKAEYERGHIPGALPIPVDELRARLTELDPEKPVYVHCQTGLRSYLACRLLEQKNFTCFNLSGGYRFYQMVMEDAEYSTDPTHNCGISI